MFYLHLRLSVNRKCCQLFLKLKTIRNNFIYLERKKKKLSAFFLIKKELLNEIFRCKYKNKLKSIKKTV